MKNYYKLNLAGKRFGKLIAVEDVGKHKTRRGRLWKCICDCGNEPIVEASHLNGGTTKSCGCSVGNPMASLNRNYHGLSNTYPFKKYHHSKKIAKRDGKHFDMDFSDFYDWYISTPDTCCYCDRPIGEVHNVVPSGITIDRKDNGFGYTLDNVCKSCYKCNTVKNDIFTYDEMCEIGQKYMKTKWN